MSRVLWMLALLAAGSLAVAVCHATTPVTQGEGSPDLLDSALLPPAFVALAVAAGLAGWFARPPGPLWGALFGVAAAAPFFAVFLAGVAGGEGQGLWPVGLAFLVLLTLIPVVAALVTAGLAARRARTAGTSG